MTKLTYSIELMKTGFGIRYQIPEKGKGLSVRLKNRRMDPLVPVASIVKPNSNKLNRKYSFSLSPRH